jgi:hypothetical protein
MATILASHACAGRPAALAEEAKFADYNFARLCRCKGAA